MTRDMDHNCTGHDCPVTGCENRAASDDLKADARRASFRAEHSPAKAKQRVQSAASLDEAGAYLYREVGVGAVEPLAREVGMRTSVTARYDRSWCRRLAERLRGNPIAVLALLAGLALAACGGAALPVEVFDGGSDGVAPCAHVIWTDHTAPVCVDGGSD